VAQGSADLVERVVRVAALAEVRCCTPTADLVDYLGAEPDHVRRALRPPRATQLGVHLGLRADDRHLEVGRPPARGSKRQRPRPPSPKTGASWPGTVVRGYWHGSQRLHRCQCVRSAPRLLVAAGWSARSADRRHPEHATRHRAGQR